MASRWSRDGGSFEAAADRAQRHTLALRDVDYVIRADVEVRPDVGEDAAKFHDQFWRRVRDGRCFATPYLGCREFAAAFAEPNGEQGLEGLDEDLGPMLLDLDYSSDGSGRGTPRSFHARLEAGVLRVPTPHEGGQS